MKIGLKFYRNSGNSRVLADVPPGARKILDVGCGAGDNAAALASRGMVVDGITLSATEASAAAAVCRRVLVHDLERGLPSGVGEDYDCCICSHVLEHICWPESLLRDIHQSLSASNGLLIVALPNFLFIKQRLALVRGDFQYESDGTWDDTHFRWYTFVTGRKLLESHGFEVISASADGHLPLGTLRRIFPSCAAKLDAWLCRSWPGLFGYQFLYSARPIRTASYEK